MLDLNLKEAAKEIVDEAVEQAPKLDPELKQFVDYFGCKLKELIVGRKITITIE